MKNLLLLLLFVSGFTHAQTDDKNEIIVSGNAGMNVIPDIAIISITIEKNTGGGMSAIENLNLETEKVSVILKKIGFKPDNIAISEYNVASEREYNSDSDSIRDRTTTAKNVLRIEFNLDNKLINAFYQEMQKLNGDGISIDFETEVSKELDQITRAQLVRLAIMDAKNKGYAIASALEVKLGKVKQVSKFYDGPRYDMRLIAAASLHSPSEIKFVNPGARSSFDKFKVEEKELNEEISIIFEIEKK